MAKAILIYGTITGNTETLSKGVAERLRKDGVEVTVKDAVEANVNDYALIVFCCSTWSEGELQDDFIDFYDKMKGIFFARKKAAVFGPGENENRNNLYFNTS